MWNPIKPTTLTARYFMVVDLENPNKKVTVQNILLDIPLYICYCLSIEYKGVRKFKGFHVERLKN